MPRVPIVEAIMERAVEVQAQLAASSRHRSVSLPDRMAAACAEYHQLILLHYDSDFDRVAGITNQPTRWIVPPVGSRSV